MNYDERDAMVDKIAEGIIAEMIRHKDIDPANKDEIQLFLTDAIRDGTKCLFDRINILEDHAKAIWKRHNTETECGKCGRKFLHAIGK